MKRKIKNVNICSTSWWVALLYEYPVLKLTGVNGKNKSIGKKLAQKERAI
jgi:hypothetical protein